MGAARRWLGWRTAAGPVTGPAGPAVERPGPAVGRRLAWAAGTVLLLATVVVGVRVLAPADALTRAAIPYPERAETPEPKAYGDLASAPLIVDRRLRVFAGPRHLWADAHVRAHKPATPFWSLWRWPAQVRAVAVLPGPVVVSQWSDDTVLALDARTGTELWRAHTPTGGAYTGRRTGAATVYAPESLLVSTSDAGTVVLSLGRGRVVALDAGTGRRLWSAALPAPGCPGWTAPGLFVACAGTPDGAALTAYDAATGRPAARWAVATGPEPLGCAAGRSGCPALRAGGAAWLVGPGGARTAAPALAPAGAWLAGARALTLAPDGVLTAADPVSGVVAWRRATTAGGRIVALSAGLAHLVTPDRMLLTVRLSDGRPAPPVRLVPTGHHQEWRVGHVYAADGFVTVERIRGAESEPDGPYYYGIAPIEIIGS